ncbi:MAG: winged helix-turn-helix domain-containing protein [Pseudoxanthomonas sp.]|nr:winged helix-turn-helix domain-containing protein [Pseudoxanthomonas sp.]
MKAGESSPPLARHYHFGGFVLDTLARELRRVDGSSVPLTAKAFDVLCVLVQDHDRVVGRDELFARVWPGRVVEENTLTQAVSALRHALGADERYVATVPGRGYRFVAEVGEGEPPAATAEIGAPSPRSAWGRHGSAIWIGTAAALALFAVLGLSLHGLPESGPQPAHAPAAVRAAAPVQATLAVLPFRSLSAGVQDEWLGLGLADTLSSRIGESAALHVYPSSSSSRLAGMAGDPLGAARRLGVDYVVDGSTQRDGDDIKVDVRLLAAVDGRLLWSDSFSAPGDRVFVPPSRIAEGLFAALAVKGVDRGHHSPCDGEDAEAYRAYLRGQYQLGRPSAERTRRAVVEFQHTIERDPTCAPAYAGLAYAYRSLAVVADADPNLVFPLAKAAVARALELDPTLAEAYVSRGWIQLWYDWDWPASEASFRRAIELDPGLPGAHFGYANLLAHTGRRAEAVAPMRQALSLDPLSPVFNAIGGWAMASAGQGDYVDRALELDPDYFLALLLRGSRRQREGDLDGALADLQRARQLCGGCSHAMNALGNLQARSGHAEAARAILREMEARDREGYWPASSLAMMHNALGEPGVALDLLERAWRERDTRMSFLLIDLPVRWDNLHGEPRFQALEQRMDFPAADTPARTNTPASASSSAADRNSR